MGGYGLFIGINSAFRIKNQETNDLLHQTLCLQQQRRKAYIMKDNSKTLPYQHKLTVAVDRALMSRCRITGFGGITNVPADKSADYNPISSVCEQDEINEGRMTLTICPVDANLFA